MLIESLRKSNEGKREGDSKKLERVARLRAVELPIQASKGLKAGTARDATARPEIIRMRLLNIQAALCAEIS